MIPKKAFRLLVLAVLLGTQAAGSQASEVSIALAYPTSPDIVPASSDLIQGIYSASGTFFVELNAGATSTLALTALNSNQGSFPYAPIIVAGPLGIPRPNTTYTDTFTNVPANFEYSVSAPGGPMQKFLVNGILNGSLQVTTDSSGIAVGGVSTTTWTFLRLDDVTNGVVAPTFFTTNSLGIASVGYSFLYDPNGVPLPLTLLIDASDPLEPAVLPPTLLGGSISVSASLPATSLSVADAVGAVGQTVLLRAVLHRKSDNAVLTGKTLTFSMDGTSVGAASGASATVPASVYYAIPTGLGAGNHTLSVAFAGDADNAPSAGSATLAVHYNTLLKVGNANAIAGQSVLLRGLLRRYTDGTAVGSKTVTFKIDGTAVGTATTAANGTVSLNYTVPASLGPGGHVLRADYAGDPAYFASTATGAIAVHFNTLTQTANAAGKAGQTALLRGKIRRYPDGAGVAGKTLTFKIDGTSVGTAKAASDGTVSLNYAIPNGTSAGSHTITLAFAGDAGYNASSGTATLTVAGR